MNRVRMGVIGLGWFGVKHCEALAASSTCGMAARASQRLTPNQPNPITPTRTRFIRRSPGCVVS